MYDPALVFEWIRGPPRRRPDPRQDRSAANARCCARRRCAAADRGRRPRRNHRPRAGRALQQRRRPARGGRITLRTSGIAHRLCRRARSTRSTRGIGCAGCARGSAARGIRLEPTRRVRVRQLGKSKPADAFARALLRARRSKSPRSSSPTTRWRSDSCAWRSSAASACPTISPSSDSTGCRKARCSIPR